MNIQDVAERTGLPLRHLRYVLDHRVVPDLRYELAQGEAGRPRVFSNELGIEIACAAWLLNAGVKRDAVEFLLRKLAELVHIPGKRQFYSTFVDLIHGRIPTTILLGDGRFIRCIAEAPLKFDSGWLSADRRAKPSDDYKPVATIQFDLGLLCDRLFGRGQHD